MASAKSATKRELSDTGVENFLTHDGEMAQLIHAFDWSTTSLGALGHWTPTLKIAINILLHSPVPMVTLWGSDGVMIYNDAYSCFAGQRHPQLLGSKVLQGWPEVREFNRHVMKQVLAGKILSYKDQELTLYRNNEPEQVWMDLNYSPIMDDRGKPAGVLSIVAETTDRVLDRRKLKASEQRFKTLIEQSSDAIELISETGKLLFASDSVERVTGYTAKELLEYTGGPEEFVHPDDQKVFFAKLTMLVAHPEHRVNFEYRIRHKDGSWIWVEATATNHLKTPGIHAIVANFRNVTARRTAEMGRRESEERLRFMAESMPQKVFTVTPTGKVDYFNYEWITFTGVSYAEFKQNGITSYIHPHDVENVSKQWQRALRSGEPLRLENRFRRYDGVYHWHLTRARPMRDEEGNVIRWFGSSTDIQAIKSTMRRKNELEKITLGLREQRAKLMALNEAQDEFISIASHQLRTPATATKQYVGMLLEGFAGDLTTQQRTMLEQAQKSNERQIAIIKDLLLVASLDAGKIDLRLNKVDLVELVESVASEQQTKLRERRQKVVVRHSKICRVSADPELLRMVIENLLDNASKYSPESTTIKLTLACEAGKAHIAFSDQGVGIHEEDMGKLFRKFSRIDNPFSQIVGGSGLGLYWAKKIIDLHGGTITVNSSPGVGTTFTVALTAAPKSAARF